MADMPQIENKILANRLRSIAGELVGISKNIENEGFEAGSKPFMFEEGAAGGRNGDEIDDLQLAAHAERLYQERRRRSRFFPEHLFAEPAWDILLDLFVNGVRNRAISITSACIAGGIPATTGLRWLGVLEKEGLLAREVSAEDARVTWVLLSDYGMNIMRSYIIEASGLSLRGMDGEIIAEG
ncbi:MAG: MarR family transcriptional regulator [Novosphingobium sp.]